MTIEILHALCFAREGKIGNKIKGFGRKHSMLYAWQCPSAIFEERLMACSGFIIQSFWWGYRVL